jgi:hypothetical protein
MSLEGFTPFQFFGRSLEERRRLSTEVEELTSVLFKISRH